MRTLKKMWIIVLTSVLIVIGAIVVKMNFTEAHHLSKDEMHAQLAEMYDSEVEDLTLKGNTYEARVVKDGAEYTVKADAESGNVLSLTQTKEIPPQQTAENNEKPSQDDTDPQENDEKNIEKPNKEDEYDQEDKKDKETEEPYESEDEEPTRLITEEEAIQIGFNELPEGMTGEIDDVDFEESTEGGYYLIEIEVDTDDDLDEVTYQIHAISGEILTTKWDD